MSVFEDDATIDKHIQLLHAAGITTTTKYPHSFHNCWGLTAHLLGWTEEPEPYWVSSLQMIEMLNTNSVPISKASVLLGDIVVFGHEHLIPNATGNLNAERYALEHTALLTDTNGASDNWCYIHKPGELLPEVQTLDGVDSWHSYCSPTHIQQFRHPI